MVHSAFYHELNDYKDDDIDIKLVWIVDSCIGNMDVTQDMKNVVDYICNIRNINREDYLWIYADSDCIWDAYDPITEEFIELACADIIEAIHKYVEIRREEMVELVYNLQ